MAYRSTTSASCNGTTTGSSAGSPRPISVSRRHDPNATQVMLECFAQPGARDKYATRATTVEQCSGRSKELRGVPPRPPFERQAHNDPSSATRRSVCFFIGIELGWLDRGVQRTAAAGRGGVRIRDRTGISEPRIRNRSGAGHARRGLLSSRSRVRAGHPSPPGQTVQGEERDTARGERPPAIRATTPHPFISSLLSGRHLRRPGYGVCRELSTFRMTSSRRGSASFAVVFVDPRCQPRSLRQNRMRRLLHLPPAPR